MRYKKSFSLCAAFVFALGFGTTSMTGNAAEPKDNRLWGEFASATAHLPGIDGKGGGMGAHSRSTKAADNVGGFANSDNVFGITFNVKEPGEKNAGRRGAANQTRFLGFEPGEGGMGQHAVANCQAANVIDPVTGQAISTNAIGDCPELP